MKLITCWQLYWILNFHFDRHCFFIDSILCDSWFVFFLERENWRKSTDFKVMPKKISFSVHWMATFYSAVSKRIFLLVALDDMTVANVNEAMQSYISAKHMTARPFKSVTLYCVYLLLLVSCLLICYLRAFHQNQVKIIWFNLNHPSTKMLDF